MFGLLGFVFDYRKDCERAVREWKSMQRGEEDTSLACVEDVLTDTYSQKSRLCSSTHPLPRTS